MLLGLQHQQQKIHSLPVSYNCAVCISNANTYE